LRHVFLITLSIIIAIFLARSGTFHTFLLHLGKLGFIGAFFAGMFFVSTFTVAEATVTLLILAETLSPIEIGLVAGLGAVVGDLTIFHIVKDDLTQDLTYMYNKFGDHHLQKLFKSKYFHWTLPVIGALLIASPLPDEVGVSLLGISKMNSIRFSIISFLLNSTGIFLVVLASTVIKP